MINKEYLKSLDPCEDRYALYLEHYKDFSGTLEEFLNLDILTHHDKVWVFVRSMPKDLAVLFAADCAERVLHIYEDKYPNDDRPRKAIEAARSGDAASAAAYVAAYAAYADAFADAAAYAASYASYAASYAAASAAAYAAAAANKQSEQAAQLGLMKKYANEAREKNEKI